MSIEVKGKVDVSGIKRCYVDAQIHLPCKECGSIMLSDLTNNYLSYPETGNNICLPFYCEKCKDWQEVVAKIENVEMTIKIYTEGDKDE